MHHHSLGVLLIGLYQKAQPIPNEHLDGPRQHLAHRGLPQMVEPALVRHPPEVARIDAALVHLLNQLGACSRLALQLIQLAEELWDGHLAQVLRGRSQVIRIRGSARSWLLHQAVCVGVERSQLRRPGEADLAGVVAPVDHSEPVGHAH